jgi:hypothetical protein
MKPTIEIKVARHQRKKPPTTQATSLLVHHQRLSLNLEQKWPVVLHRVLYLVDLGYRRHVTQTVKRSRVQT